MLLFQPNDPDVTLEMTIGRRVLRWFGLGVGQAATAGLPPEDVLLLQDVSTPTVALRALDREM